MKEGKLLLVDEVSNLTKSNVKKVKMIRDGKLEEFLYQGELNDFYKELEGHNIEDLLVEEPPLDEIFMHYYQA